jgi:hypothetical protein
MQERGAIQQVDQEAAAAREPFGLLTDCAGKVDCFPPDEELLEGEGHRAALEQSREEKGDRGE